MCVSLFFSPLILNDLIDIQEIRGSLDISGFNRADFPYLSNLKMIGTYPNEVLSLFCNVSDSSERSKYSINIVNTHLESIDLSSLESVRGGGVRLVDNPSLCYLGNLSYYLSDTSFSSCILDGHRRSEDECGKSTYVFITRMILVITMWLLNCNKRCLYLVMEYSGN